MGWETLRTVRMIINEDESTDGLVEELSWEVLS